jgi:hypothetical protein
MIIVCFLVSDDTRNMDNHYQISILLCGISETGYREPFLGQRGPSSRDIICCVYSHETQFLEGKKNILLTIMAFVNKVLK